MTETADDRPKLHKARFLHNVVWGWLAVAVNILIGLVLSPVIVRKLGVERYGVWVLLFSTIEYLRMLDLGLRAAVVNAVARLRARKDWVGVNRTAATATLYFVLISLGCCGVVIGLRGIVIGVFDIPSALRPEARALIVLIVLTVAMRLAFTPIPATLEAFQRYDLINRAYISALLLRSTGSIVVLFLGYGLIEMAYVVLIAQIGENLWNFVSVTRTVPTFRVKPDLMRFEALSNLFQYARHSAVMSAANLVSIQVPTTALGYLRGPTEVGFFALPYRLLMYIAEAIAKVADVTSSVTAGLDDQRDSSQVWRLAVLTNRHCFALFLPAAVFLGMYATPLLRVWISPEVGAMSGRFIPVLLIGFVFAVAGQYNAGAILLGQGKHAWYAYGIVAEVIVSALCLFAFVPRYGAAGTAWVVSIVMTARGLYLAILLCRLNGFPFWLYMSAVYSRPSVTAIPVILVGVGLRASVWPGRNWFELITAGIVICTAYFSLAFFSVLDNGDRLKVLERIRLFLQSKSRAAV